MAGSKKSVIWEPWIERAIWDIANEKGKNFSWTANYLVETKLNDLKRYRDDYEPEMGDLIKSSKSEGKRLEMEADLLIEIVQKRTGNRTWGDKLYLYKAGEGPITFAEIKQRHSLVWAEVKKEGYDPMELLALHGEEIKKVAS
jgi:hypothetical protein